MSVSNLKSVQVQIAVPLRSRRFNTIRPIPQKLHATSTLPQYTGLHFRSPFLSINDDQGTPLDLVQNGSTVFAMRHRKKVKKLGRTCDQRKALIRGLVTELLRHGKIKTTTPRAKAIRPFVDKMIGLAKRGDLHARRQALGFIYDKKLVRNIFEKVPERYTDRNSGFTRVKKVIKTRRGDNAELSTIELV
eukprot:g3007.t1